MGDTQHDPGHGHDDHGHDEGGHEIDRMPNARLFNLLFGLSALTLLSCIGVIQLFNMQVDALEHSRAEQGSFRIAEYTEEMNKQKSGWGRLEVKELDDKNTVSQRFYMPLASAKKAVLEDANLLKALAPPPGWKTADDKAPAPGAAKPAEPPRPGMQPGGAPAPTPVPTDGGVKPGEPTPPAGDAPAGDKPAGDKPAGDTPAGDKPAGDAPAPKGDDAKADDAKADDAKAEKPAKPKPTKPKPAKPAPAEPADAPAADDAG